MLLAFHTDPLRYHSLAPGRFALKSSNHQSSLENYPWAIGYSLSRLSKSRNHLIVYIPQGHLGVSCLLVGEYEIPAPMLLRGTDSAALFILQNFHRFELRLELHLSWHHAWLLSLCCPDYPTLTNFSWEHFLNKSPLQESSSQVLLLGNTNWHLCWFWMLELYLPVSLPFILKW